MLRPWWGVQQSKSEFTARSWRWGSWSRGRSRTRFYFSITWAISVTEFATGHALSGNAVSNFWKIRWVWMTYDRQAEAARLVDLIEIGRDLFRWLSMETRKILSFDEFSIYFFRFILWLVWLKMFYGTCTFLFLFFSRPIWRIFCLQNWVFTRLFFLAFIALIKQGFIHIGWANWFFCCSANCIPPCVFILCTLRHKRKPRIYEPSMCDGQFAPRHLSASSVINRRHSTPVGISILMLFLLLFFFFFVFNFSLFLCVTQTSN